MIGVATPITSADRAIAIQIVSHLADTHRASLRRLSVDVHAGEVTLRGSVSSFYEKQIAIQACRMLPGIDRLIDALEVAGSCEQAGEFAIKQRYTSWRAAADFILVRG